MGDPRKVAHRLTTPVLASPTAGGEGGSWRSGCVADRGVGPPAPAGKSCPGTAASPRCERTPLPPVRDGPGAECRVAQAEPNRSQARAQVVGQSGGSTGRRHVARPGLPPRAPPPTAPGNPGGTAAPPAAPCPPPRGVTGWRPAPGRHAEVSLATPGCPMVPCTQRLRRVRFGQCTGCNTARSSRSTSSLTTSRRTVAVQRAWPRAMSGRRRAPGGTSSGGRAGRGVPQRDGADTVPGPQGPLEGAATGRQGVHG
jgi:hypothetical protein